MKSSQAPDLQDSAIFISKLLLPLEPFRNLPANRVWPSADQARLVTWGGSALADPGTSGLRSSTRFLLSRSQTLMEGPLAAHSQYLLGEKVRLWMVSLLSRV